MRTIDAHQHFRRYDPVALGWIDPATAPAQDCLPPDVRIAMDRAGIDDSIAGP